MEQTDSPLLGSAELEEVACRTLHGLLDAIAPRSVLDDPRSMALAQRRLCVLSFVLQRPGYDRVNGAEIARRYGCTKQAVNLDIQEIAKRFRITGPTAHRTTNGRAPAWCTRSLAS